jgi:hypothetical protein
MDYQLLGEPQKALTKKGEFRTGMKELFATELRALASQAEGDFSMVWNQMDVYERHWRMEAERTSEVTDKRLKRYLPSLRNSDPRNLCDQLVRANTKQRAVFRVPLGGEWTEGQQSQSQRLERYLQGSLYMGDADRRHARLDPVQNALAWYLVVRGMGIYLPLLRSSPRQQSPDALGDAAFMLRTPDPRECAYLLDGLGISAFSHHYYRDAASLRHRADLQAARENPTKRDEGLCDTVNMWWRSDDGHVWNATIVENDFSVMPMDWTAKRQMHYLPVFVDSAYGAPAEARLFGSDSASLMYKFQGALENNIDLYRTTNKIRAYQMAMLEKSALYALVTFSDGRRLNRDEVDKAFQGNALIQMDHKDRVEVLAPPQLSDGLKELLADMNVGKREGGLPGAVAGNVPAGMAGVLAAMLANQGDMKAGPVSDALKRLLVAGGDCLVAQLRYTGRVVNVQGVDGYRRAFMEKFDPKSLPAPGEYLLEVMHEPELVKDEYQEANTMAVLRNAGMPLLSMFDRMSKDPLEEMNRWREERIEGDPGVASLRAAAAMFQRGRDDLGNYFMQRAMQLIAPAGAGAGGSPGGGVSPSPAMGVDPEAGAMPAMQSMGGMGGAPVDPSQPNDQARLGALGLAYGGR